MDKKGLQQVLACYGLRAGRFFDQQKGYRNTSHPIELRDGRQVNFIIYKHEPGMLERIKRTNTVAEGLALKGLPVRTTYDRRILQLGGARRTLYGALYHYLPGETIPWEAYTKSHIKLLGAAMSTMHAAMKAGPAVENSVADETTAFIERMENYHADEQVWQALVAKLSLRLHLPSRRMKGIVNSCAALPGSQTLHMDFVRGNILFGKPSTNSLLTLNGVALCGILDFEKVAFGHPIFDIARTLAFLYVDCPQKSPSKIKKYFLQSGYNKRGRSIFAAPIISYRGQKIDLLEELIAIYLTYDFYKFLRHNPYESLIDNHHFLRTRDILIRRKMVQYDKNERLS